MIDSLTSGADLAFVVIAHDLAANEAPLFGDSAAGGEFFIWF